VGLSVSRRYGRVHTALWKCAWISCSKSCYAETTVLHKTILLIQDDAAEAESIRAALSSSRDGLFEIDWFRHCSHAMQRLDRPEQRGWVSGIAAILVDLFLPDSRGVETFERLFQLAPHIPIMVLTSAEHEDVAKLAVQRGAHEYLLKSRLDSYLLPKAVRSMIERAANLEALFEEKERAQVTLNSIGDAVISTDVSGRITYLNAIAERLTGWPNEQAIGQPFQEVFRIVNATTREAAPNPMTLAIREDKTVGLTPNCVLIRRDGVEAAIEDSAAPIHDRRGQVTGAVMVFHDVSAARAMSLKMSHLAQHDNLTNLPNRALMNDRLVEAIALSKRYGRKLALLFLDLDRFKQVNDSLGHVIGDRLLRSVARRLCSSVRSSDTVSRQGGDEFVILLWEVRCAEDAAIAADNILHALRQPHFVDQHAIFVTASIGIVTYPDDGTDAETLLNNADFAMYHAKDNERDSYQFFNADMCLRAVERQSIEADLRIAIERQEFVLHYQPKIDLLTGEIVGVEALIRWSHVQRGLIPPVQFIAIAEESGLIVPIGRWVLREACRQARAWQLAGLAPVRIAVNISSVELRAPHFALGVSAILTETGLDPHYLELELTETFLMQDSKSTLVVLKELTDIGVMLALDDFGTGYSSLSYLRRFPISTLKIDKAFVNGLTADLNDASIVTAVIGMGNNLNLRVIAEGVETREQLEFLREHNCPFGQGFYFSRPLAPKEMGALLRAGLLDLETQGSYANPAAC
jgi:diguanylate cyclase (GGDEF)-like protein/PAS domain S-box-containing protein